MTEEQIEKSIIDEVPYNWKKHLIFHTPSIARLFVYVTVAIFLYQVLTITLVGSFMAAMITNIDPEWIKQNLIENY